MHKNADTLQSRKDFIESVMNNTEVAIIQLKTFTLELQRAKNTSQKVDVLAKILFLSEVTIFKDFAGK